ncbi:DUF305 domain-containing protein [Pseudolysinimonas yzui]|uniref:DUF305 domain-containing protein n=1 Tax=Pseudolysinimonas yzui TaxID=2708254 RepID=A0A8J3M0G6_9MICO|nr:DUF305 domain-containing protein [Pseudolysinimonas yzui]GHF17144.1 DUF305 domain-containing protein [Pseudolysinimonas yzui]
MRTRAAIIPAIGVALLLTLTGCVGFGMRGPGQGPGQGPGPGTPTDVVDFNISDVHFNMMMIPHHEQAIEMSQIILAADDIHPDVTDLATRIAEAQAPEIEQMEAWLDARGYPTPPDGMPGHGMMSDGDLDRLRDLDGVDAEVLFLTAMIDHHEGAIEMAEDEIDDGIDPETIALCERIIESQTAEIEEMQALLAAR